MVSGKFTYLDFCSTLFEMHSLKPARLKVMNYKLYRITRTFDQIKDKVQICITLYAGLVYTAD